MNRRIMTLIALGTAAVFLGAAAASAATWPTGVRKVAVPTARVAGPDRFSTAVAIAKKTYPAWGGVTHVIIASGDDRAAADPLGAASLCWAYDAPLLLTTKSSTPASTRAALAAIVSANTTVTVHVVGGTGSVPAARVREIRGIVGTAGLVEQPWKVGDRYSVSRGIAARVRTVAADTSRTIPAAVFVANGESRDKFWDVLSVSAISRHTGIPVLLTAKNTVPWATTAALADMPGTGRVIVGGTGSVSARVYTKVGGTSRWGGADRYAVATNVATRSAAAGWADPSVFAIAVAMPDAVTGAGLVGREGGVLLLSGRERVNRATWSLLSNPSSPPVKGYLLGGTGSAAPSLLAELNGAPAMPALGTNTPAALSGSTALVSGSVGGNTTSIKLVVNGVTKATKTVVPWGTFTFGRVDVPNGGAKITVTAGNPDGKTASLTRTVLRLKFPYATCIVIDKSDFKLYWVRNNVLVKVYPIAIGRSGMETPIGTWKILAKYKTDPSSVYGPRKMRMFRQVGNSFVFTAYAIHGTNQEWVIGTKASHGCIRMYNREVLELWPQVPLGTMVVTRP